MKAEVVRTEEAVDRHLQKMQDIVTLHLQGYKPFEIAKSLGVSPSTVGSYIREWRELASNNQAMKDRATVALRAADEHYSALIKRTYGVLEDAEDDGSVPQRLAAIKMLTDIEKTRITLLQQAGILEDSDVGRKVAETERKHRILTEILKDTISTCSHCRPIVQQKLKEVVDEPVIVKVSDDVGPV